MRSSEFHDRNTIQQSLMRRYCEATGDFSYWISHGCAESFDKAWKEKVRHPEALYQYIIQNAKRVNQILDK
jgi:hypothetical protein